MIVRVISLFAVGLIGVLVVVVIIGVFFFVFSLIGYSSISESKGSKIASSSLIVIVKALIFSSNLVLVIARAVFLVVRV